MSDSEMCPNWHPVAACRELDEGTAIERLVAGRIVAIFRTGGRLYAMDGMCAHQGGPLADGLVADGCVTCPWHGWQYTLDEGIQTVNRQPLQETFEVREREGMIEVRLER